MKAARLRFVAIVFAAVNILLILVNIAMISGFWISEEMYLQQAYNSEPNGGIVYQADYTGLFALLIPALICAVAAVILFVSVIRRKKSCGLSSSYWFMSSAAALILAVYFINVEPSAKNEITKYCIISLICFALTGVFGLVWTRSRKGVFLTLAAATVIFLLIFQLFMLFELGFASFLYIGTAFPWFPAVPLIPAAVMAMAYLEAKEAELY